MKEYIEREAAIKKLNDHLHAMVDDAPISQGTKDIYEMAYRHVEDVLRKLIPAADVVEVRHGRWIDSEEDGHPTICGVCNYPVDRFYKTKYCPNCGAKMTEDRHEQKE